MWQLYRFRFLAVVCLLCLIPVYWELTTPAEVSTMDETEFPAVWEQLYPESDESIRIAARRHIENGEFQEARELLERVIDQRVRSNELVFYDYCLVLIQQGEEITTIREAIQRWRVNFPDSDLPVPRIPRDEP